MQFSKRITISIQKNEKWDVCLISLDKRDCDAFLEDGLNWYSGEL